MYDDYEYDYEEDELDRWEAEAFVWDQADIREMVEDYMEEVGQRPCYHDYDDYDED